MEYQKDDNIPIRGDGRSYKNNIMLKIIEESLNKPMWMCTTSGKFLVKLTQEMERNREGTGELLDDMSERGPFQDKCHLMENKEGKGIYR